MVGSGASRVGGWPRSRRVWLVMGPMAPSLMVGGRVGGGYGGGGSGGGKGFGEGVSGFGGSDEEEGLAGGFREESCGEGLGDVLRGDQIDCETDGVGGAQSGGADDGDLLG